MRPGVVSSCLVLLLGASVAAAADGVPSDVLDDLYRPWRFWSALVSPDGSLVAAQVFEKDRLRVRVVDPATGAFVDVVDLHSQEGNRMGWVDSSILAVVEAHEDLPRNEGLANSTHLVSVRREGDELRTSQRVIKTGGFLVDTLPAAGDDLLYAVEDRRGAVYRLSARALIDLADPASERSEDELLVDDAEVAKLRDEALYWVVDSKGDVRAGIGLARHGVRVWYRAHTRKRFRKVLTWREWGDVDVIPYGISSDGDNLLVMTNHDRERWGVYEFDPEEAQIGARVYEHPSLDISGVIDDGAGRTVGVTYVEAGQVVYHYFGEADAEIQKTFAERFAGKSISILNRSLDGRRAIAWVRSPSDPGAFHLLDVETKIATDVGHLAPWLDDRGLSDVRVLEFRAPDGLELEAFVALPRDPDGLPPLVVLPHGGPIGVTDNAEFGRDVQHLALAGFAVLQVNYRGSGGRGRTFLDAGRGEWGRGIEDDIDHALEKLLETGWVDPERMCIVGSSYGGYSALMSIIRHPSRFRCAASIAGVTDIGLMFTSSDFAATEAGREEFARTAGDPATEYSALKQRSPTYLASQISTPLLIVHGAKDVRVTVEHARRLRRMLDIHGKDYEYELYEDMGHGFESLEQMRRQQERLERFLRAHLIPDVTGGASGDRVGAEPDEPVGDPDHDGIQEQEADSPDG